MSTLSLESLVKNLDKKVISRDDGKPYLTRYYLYRKTSPELPSIYIHQFHRGDQDLELHDHPWSRSISFILRGSYLEEYRVGEPGNYHVLRRILKPGMFNYITAERFHRVDLLTDEVWTLFISGGKTQSWGFWDRETGEYWDWTEHAQRKNHNVVDLGSTPNIALPDFRSNYV